MSKLDQQSLGKCRCVCRSWRKTLSDSRVLSVLREQSRRRSSNSFVFVCNEPFCHRNQPKAWNTLKTVDLNCNSSSSGSTTRWLEELDYGIVDVLPVCYDLVCFLMRREVRLCDPRTGQVYSLPENTSNVLEPDISS
ncbi:OLC1v1026944C1 [Oldenlandia corymbosa var. corymbosa]|uniref:OLC1v1026944C1 n=1 Tax=Oldenlandia corymbosa var. corymbosa TaxID=529605 RepID=A0AAV1CA89_OLDCO|nr:OLC1v1026944C1 [Oldenlandia corymbosa var. corymbosa]